MILTQEIADHLIYHHILMEDNANSYFEDGRGEVTPLDFGVNWQCTVSIANWIWMNQMMGFGTPSITSRGSYYTHGDEFTFEVGQDLPDGVIEALQGLEDYPLIDDEVHSTLEWEILEADVVECITSFVYSTTIQDFLAEHHHSDEDFQKWFDDYWVQSEIHFCEYIEDASFHIDFEEHYGQEGIEMVQQDFLAHAEITGLAEQGWKQHAFFQKKQS